ncbi:MAG: hypothetical protein JNM72_23930 [Deltaproteobacteria bacterium]|nr:hypothetical protein [Deltaproteobacteria bacterium]
MALVRLGEHIVLGAILAVGGLAVGGSARAAAPLLLEVGAPVPVGRGGNWVRTHPHEDGGWWFFQAAGGGYHGVVMSADLAFNERALVELTGRTDLQDHVIVPCPGGGFLHAASYSRPSPNDSAVIWRLDAALGVVDTAVVEEGEGDRAHNDLVTVCREGRSPLGLTRMAGGTSAEAFWIDGGLAAEGPVAVPAQTFMGSSLIAEGEGYLMAFVEGPGDTAVNLQALDADLAAAGPKRRVELGGGVAFWPQGMHRLSADRLLLIHLEAEDQGHGPGDVWLRVIDDQDNVIESAPLFVSEPRACSQPWLSRQGDRLLASYSCDLQPYVQEITLNLDGVEVVDDDGGGEGAADEAEEEGGKGAGCAHVPAPAAAWGLGALLALGLRRRRR